MKNVFYKFPSTPHIAVLGNNDVRNDKCFSTSERELFLSNEIIIEEKIDGANLGISFDNNGNLIFQNRGNTLQPPYTGQWKKLQEWIEPKIDSLFEILDDHLILFGEWCYAKHSIPYDHLPDWFIAFDVYDKNRDKFWSVVRRNKIIENINIPCVPEIKRGYFSFQQLKEMSFKSRFGQQNAEGIYLRVDNDQWLLNRAKLVRPAFRQGIDEHWLKGGIIANQIKAQFNQSYT